MANLAASLSVLVVLLLPALASAQGLHELAVRSGKLFFGTATDTNLFGDAAYMAVLNRTGEFGLVVPENSQKWDATEKTQGEFRFEKADAVAGVARANGMMMRCHALTWHSQLPQFVSQGTFTRETLTPVIEAHVANVVGHYRGQCYSWDVVNEALADDGSLRDSVFSRAMGRDFIPVSFAAAAAADPGAKLYYNDFSLEFNSKKTDGAVKIVSDLKAAGVKVDGVGLQAHLEVGKTPPPATLAAVMGRFADLGLEVALTELDIRHKQVPADEAAVQQQAKDYASVIKTCVDTKACVGVVAWEFTDKYSWIPATFRGQGDACLFDAEMRAKPAYESVRAVLMAAAAGANGTAGPGAGAGVGGGGATQGGGGAMAAVEVAPSSSDAAASRALAWAVGAAGLGALVMSN